jgi:hypothetical protein
MRDTRLEEGGKLNVERKRQEEHFIPNEKQKKKGKLPPFFTFFSLSLEKKKMTKMGVVFFF